MKTHRLRAAICAVFAVLICVPTSGVGDVVRLKDGSTINGRVLSLVGDTLAIRTSFGSTLRIPRTSIELVSFTDSIATDGLSNARVVPAPAVGRTGDGPGKIGVTFVDTRLSSKVEVERGKEKRERLRANWIETVLVVDDAEVYASVDSTMDKTIYEGPVRVFKNTVELEDFEVEVPAGFHHAVLIVRNVGIEEYEGAFQDDPVDLQLSLDNLQVASERTLRVTVAITRGKLRMGKPRFKLVE